MTRDDIIKLAREAGWSGLYTTYNAPTGKADWKMVNESLTVPVTMEQIERFAALVAAAEREECARVCDPEPSPPNEAYTVLNNKATMRLCAAAIRARGNT